MCYNFSTAGHRVTRFPATLMKRTCVFDFVFDQACYQVFYCFYHFFPYFPWGRYFRSVIASSGLAFSNTCVFRRPYNTCNMYKYIICLMRKLCFCCRPKIGYGSWLYPFALDLRYQIYCYNCFHDLTDQEQADKKNDELNSKEMNEER